MSDLRFESTLPIEEIEESFKNIDFFAGIMNGLEEALAYEKSKAAAESFIRKRSLTSINNVAFRASLRMTQ